MSGRNCPSKRPLDTRNTDTNSHLGQDGDVKDVALRHRLPRGRAHADVTGFGPLEQPGGDETAVQGRFVAKPVVPTCA